MLIIKMIMCVCFECFRPKPIAQWCDCVLSDACVVRLVSHSNIFNKNKWTTFALVDLVPYT